MGVFFNYFTLIVMMSVVLSVVLPGEETQFFKDNLFSHFLIEEFDPLLNQSIYSDSLSENLRPEWTGEVQQESGFFQRFIDALSAGKRLINTIINTFILPLTMSIRLDMPIIVRLLFFIPLTLLYAVSAFFVMIRGVHA